MHLSKYCLLITILSTSGCATFYAHSSNVGEQIDSWLADNQYDKALETIDALPTDHPDYTRLTLSASSIENKRQRFLQTTLAEASKHEKHLDWVKASKKIDEGLKSLPDAPELLARRDYYVEKRLDRTKKDEAAILLSKAQYLISSRPYRESLLYNSTNRYSSHQEFNEYLRDSKLASRELYALGYSYWQENKLVQARKALALSIQTSPNEISASLLSTILSTEKQAREVARQQQSHKASEQLPELKLSFNERLSFGDFEGAQKVLNEMAALKIADAEAFQQTLNEHKEQRVTLLIDSGNNLYNAGYIGEAVIQWNQALILSPDNQTIIQQLERANTFLENVERWKDTP